MQKTSIEWADYVWNPVTGCTKVSAGCKNCYAETFHHRFEKIRGKFTDVVCHPDRLDQPLKKRKPGIVFVNSMSDLFHEDVPLQFIDHCFSVMGICPHHTFLILTKRPERVLEWSKNYYGPVVPLPNVWLGISCEDQATADERIPLLLQIPAALRFLSCEPLLGPIDLNLSNCERLKVEGIKCDRCYYEKSALKTCLNIDWVICGGESGHKARPMHPDWARSLRDQCAAANVPFFFKQWGEWMPNDYEALEAGAKYIRLDEYNFACKLGKSKSGHLLDGKEHREFPKIQNLKLNIQN